MITGFVLAGGKSTRMGTDKSLLIWKDKTFVEHAINTLKPLCNEVIISSNNPVYDFTGCETWADELPIQAPIIGIYSCLKRSNTEVNLILSCDMPLIETDLFRYLLQYSKESNIIIPSHDSGLEPLCGVYKRSAVTLIENYISLNNYRLYECIQLGSATIIPINSHLPFFKSNMFSNINTYDAFNKLLKH
jgi:molybdopterin-guanine dinucleotide biosynthesis protein A